jgi:hypothetical protein
MAGMTFSVAAAPGASAAPQVKPAKPSVEKSAPEARHWILHTHRSALSFVMTKNSSVAEIGYFRGIYGEITPSGDMTLYVPLDKTSTQVEIRDQRMAEHLWETDKFKLAKITAKVMPSEIEKVEIGKPVKLDHIKVTIDLHGHQKEYKSRFVFFRIIEDRFIIQGLEPIIVNAADFGLTDGINKLRELAGLESISTAVPVSFDFTFESKEKYQQRIAEWKRQKAIMDQKRKEAEAAKKSAK